MIRHLSSVLAAAVLLAGASALAADLAPMPTEPAAPIYLPFSWTGFYAGVNGGYGFGNDDEGSLFQTGTGSLGTLDGLDPDGFFAGGQIGGNYQIDAFVFGVEADIQKSWMDDSFGPNAISPPTTAGVDSLGGSIDVDWFGTLRARAGWAWDRTLFYGTGGLAFGSVDYAARVGFDNERAALRSDDVEVGWVAGGGIEHAFTDNWTVKLDYQYIDLGEVTASGRRVDDAGNDLGFTASSDRDANFHTVRAGVNYKF